jgi:predicted short-subunit dehydrogenase-like oxidoreductase (DUF2520 family)
MNIIIIGSGNAASVLGRKFKKAGHQISQVISRNESEASALAYEWDTTSTNYMSLLNKEADVYIVAVPDDAIDEVVAGLKLPGKVIAHTAGSVDKEILKNVSQHYGVFYPLQTLRKEANHLPETPIFFEGSDDKANKVLEQLAHSISVEQVVRADSFERLKIHVAAVIVNNFTNHLYTLAENYCQKEGLDFKQLLPLIEETALRLKNSSPSQSQTGPAARHDQETIEKHIALLANHPQIQKIYVMLTESISRI